VSVVVTAVTAVPAIPTVPVSPIVSTAPIAAPSGAVPRRVPRPVPRRPVSPQRVVVPRVDHHNVGVRVGPHVCVRSGRSHIVVIAVEHGKFAFILAFVLRQIVGLTVTLPVTIFVSVVSVLRSCGIEFGEHGFVFRLPCERFGFFGLCFCRLFLCYFNPVVNAVQVGRCAHSCACSATRGDPHRYSSEGESDRKVS
jgi:hypothetical protein